MSGPVCPNCEEELSEGEEVCSKCGEAAVVSPPEGAQTVDPGNGEEGKPLSSDEEMVSGAGPEEDGTSDSEDDKVFAAAF